MRKYGATPIDLGLIDLSPTEMMCWLYCPIKMPGMLAEFIPPNLRQFQDIVNAVVRDLQNMTGTMGKWIDSYIYITAKTLYVSPESPGNRPGWHSDGFMTDDLNYIWSDRSGTEFWTSQNPVEFTQDHHASLKEMEMMAAAGPTLIFPDKHLLRLDERVIHRVARQKTGVRTFVKVSVSDKPYNLVGNSINHGLKTEWEYAPRGDERNHTTAEKN